MVMRSSLACLALLVAGFAVVSIEAQFHAECLAYWTVSEDCDSVQEKIIQQILLWDNADCGTQPGDTEPNGQKCLYKVSYFYI